MATEREDSEMAQIVTVLIESFAAWETSLLSAMARGSYGVDIADTARKREPLLTDLAIIRILRSGR